MTDEHGLLALLLRARRLERAAAGRASRSNNEANRLSAAAQRLEASVVRPLNDAVNIVRASASETSTVPATASTASAMAQSMPADDTSSDGDIGESLWQLARQATTLRMQLDLPTEVQEAKAALQ